MHQAKSEIDSGCVKQNHGRVSTRYLVVITSEKFTLHCRRVFVLPRFILSLIHILYSMCIPRIPYQMYRVVILVFFFIIIFLGIIVKKCTPIFRLFKKLFGHSNQKWEFKQIFKISLQLQDIHFY